MREITSFAHADLTAARDAVVRDGCALYVGTPRARAVPCSGIKRSNVTVILLVRRWGSHVTVDGETVYDVQGSGHETAGGVWGQDRFQDFAPPSPAAVAGEVEAVLRRARALVPGAGALAAQAGVP